ncbi:basic helix-loop-helix ARNT-like protein 1 isoform X3 [Calliopsis andreniformis]|uniref:basic helix-loop-helix ARNT-like protein 1 isoform X3 n=1 Tax=Calliopsis andreniformis TaxID=337506 RepID=UPI003FCEC19C
MNFADKMRKKQQQEPYMNPQLARPPLLDHGIVTTSQHQADYLPTNKDPKESRKDAERKRRVKHNQLFDKIGKLVLGVVSNADKNTIMRCAVAEIRKNMTLGSDENFLPLQVNSRVDLGQFIDNYVKGFVIVVTTVGNIVYVSKSVEDHLSYTPRDLEGCSLYDLVYRKDHEVINENLTLSEADRASLFSMHQATDMSTDSSAFLRRNFEFRMLRNDKSKQKEKKYECVSISGHFKVARKALEFIQTNPAGQKNTNDIVFVGVAQVLMKQSVTAVSIMDAHKDEYVTRHLVDGRILFCDQRVSTVTGYMAHEVTGLCAFEFMHADDYKWPIAALRQMYDRSETCGSSCYRLRQKTGKFIFLYTHGYLEYDDKGKVISYVCINTLVSAEVGSKLVKEMKIKFAATVTPPELAEPMIQNREKPAIAEIASSSQQTAGEITKEDPMQFRETIAQLVNRFNSPGLEKELPISPVSPVSQIPDQYNVKQEDVLSSGTIVEPQRPLKRKHRDDDLRTTPNKKTCPSVDMTGEQVSLPYVDCGSSVVENFNHADTSPSSLKIVETSNSTLDQTSINCQQSLLNTGDDFRDLTGDSLHSLDLDTNPGTVPDIMMLDGNVPICILQQVANDAISNQLMRIENNMKSQESELSVLFSQCMKNPELETMMKRLIMSLQDEHKTQEILLKILQQEHNEIQYKKCEA